MNLAYLPNLFNILILKNIMIILNYQKKNYPRFNYKLIYSNVVNMSKIDSFQQIFVMLSVTKMESMGTMLS